MITPRTVFQFLIGRLVTLQLAWVLSVVNGFQFLIGRLVTEGEQVAGGEEGGFNSS